MEKDSARPFEYRFIGRVFPELLKATLFTPLEVHLEITDTTSPTCGLDVVFWFAVRDARFEVQARANRNGHWDEIQIHNSAFEIIRTAVDMVSFAEGKALTVLMETIIKPEDHLSLLFTAMTRYRFYAHHSAPRIRLFRKP